MRPFVVVGLLLMLFGIFGLALAAVDYSSSGGACLGGRSCPAGYAGWYDARLAIWAVFGGVFLAFGAWLALARPRRRLGGYSGGARWGGGGPSAPARGDWMTRPGALANLRTCSACGARNGPRFRYCHRCGASLEGGAAPDPARPPSP